MKWNSGQAHIRGGPYKNTGVQAQVQATRGRGRRRTTYVLPGSSGRLKDSGIPGDTSGWLNIKVVIADAGHVKVRREDWTLSWTGCVRGKETRSLLEPKLASHVSSIQSCLARLYLLFELGPVPLSLCMQGLCEHWSYSMRALRRNMSLGVFRY